MPTASSLPANTKPSFPPTFRELGVAAEIVDALSEIGIERTFAIQELTLPLALDGNDLIGQARTGMGKTYGFGVPLLDRVFDDAAIEELDSTPRALVVVPTRELAVQVNEDLNAAAKYLPMTIAALYGGTPIEKNIEVLEKGVDVVVGTPGRLLDLYQRKHLCLDKVALLVLDEADEMLDLGFLPDIEKILAALTHEHQTMLFSATMPGPIITLARSFLNKPVRIRAEEPDASATHTSTRQVIFQSHRMDKIAVIARTLQAKGRGRTIIFTRTKRSADDVAEQLAKRGFLVGAVHGDLRQNERQKALDAFRSGTIEILVATDVAARGIDVDDVTHVINYQVPDDPQSYVHRIGRTGRAGHSGTAVTLVGYDELNKWQAINDELNMELPEPPHWFSSSPELEEALDIPASAEESAGPPRKVFGRSTRPADGRSSGRIHNRSSSRSDGRTGSQGRRSRRSCR